MKIMKNASGTYAFCDRVDSTTSDYVLVSPDSKEVEESIEVDAPLSTLVKMLEKQGFEIIGKENHK
jgi:hypothetical protein